jgi:4-carboxymuconolactone decarboxylase
MNDADRHKKGMKVRKQVLGKDHVERAEARKNAFNAPFQDLITRYAWGEIWTRPGLPKKTRSLITIAMMVAMNRTEELRLHLRASANAGVSRQDIQELLLQTAIYCGVPAANHAFQVAEEVFAEGRK